MAHFHQWTTQRNSRWSTRKSSFKKLIVQDYNEMKIGETGKLDRQEMQETQLSLTNRATHLEVSQGHQTWYHYIC